MKAVGYPGVRGAGGGGKGGSGSSRTPVEAPNTLRSKAKAKVIDIIGEGEIEGPALGGSWAKSTFLDDVPVMSADGTENYKGIVIHPRLGLPDQDYIEGFPAAETPAAHSPTEITFATPIVRRVTSAADAVRVILQIPALTELDQTTGDLKGNRVTIKIEIKADADEVSSTYVTKITDEIVGKTTSPYQRGYRIPLEGVPPFDIRVSRLTADSVAANISNDTFWLAYIELFDAKLIYPDTALVGLELDSELFGGNVPRRAYEIFGRKIKIPTNMNGLARTFSGEWDGNFKTEYCNDPAWVVYDLLTDDRFGLGDVFSPDDVHKWDFYQASVFNSAQVDDGNGGTEPRFSFNGVISTREEALEVLDAVAGMMRAALLWDGLGLTIIQDRPTDASMPFTAANVIEGQFNYVGSSLTARHSAAQVTWFNPAIAYEQDIVFIEDQEAIERYGYNVLEVVAYGCTSQAQAYRHGLAMLLAEKLETDALQFTTGMGHAAIRPGDVIDVFDPMFTTQSYGGRVAEVVDGGVGAGAITGAASITFGAFTLSAAGTVATAAATGAAALSMGAFTLSAAGTVGSTVTGDAALTMNAFTLSAAGTVPVWGEAALTMGAFTASGAGTVGSAALGDAALTMGAFTLSAAGTVPAWGDAALSMGAFSVSAAGTVTSAPATGDAALTMGAFTLSAAGTVGSASRTAPVYQSVSSSTDSATVAKPSGTVEGDLLVASFWAYASETTQTVTLPAGWTAIGGAIRTPSGAENFFGQLAYKIAGPSEPSTYTHTISGGSYRCAAILRFTSFDASDPIADYTTGNGGPNGTRTVPAATADNANSHLVVFSHGIYGVVSSTPSGMTERASVDGGTSKVYDEAIASAGAISSKTHTQSTPAEIHTWMVASVVINGAP